MRKKFYFFSRTLKIILETFFLLVTNENLKNGILKI